MLSLTDHLGLLLGQSCSLQKYLTWRILCAGALRPEGCTARCLPGRRRRPARPGARREAERLWAVADYVRLTRCWREWRGRVDGARRLQALLQRTQAHLARLREARVCCAEVPTRQCLSQMTYWYTMVEARCQLCGFAALKRE